MARKGSFESRVRTWAIGTTFFYAQIFIPFLNYLMVFEEKIESVKRDLARKAIPAIALTSNLCLIDEDSRRASAFDDPRNTPFFYYIGQYFQPSSVLEMMPGLGIYSSALIKGYKGVQSYYGWHIDTSGEYYNPRLYFKNIKCASRKVDVYLKLGQSDPEKVFDLDYNLIMLSYSLEKEIGLNLLEMAWSRMNDGSVILINYVDNDNKALATTFCGRIGRSPTHISTRYGVYMIEK